MPADAKEKCKGPLYRRIQDEMQERISRGVWVPGQALPSRRDLCAAFGTTRVTLDKAIHELVRQGILHSAKGSGTFVAKQTAPAAPEPRPLRIGVVLRGDTISDALDQNRSDNFYFGPLFEGMRDGVAGRPVEVVYAHISGSDYARFYRESALDGMILALPPLADLPALHRLQAAGVPFVAAGFSTGSPADAALPCVDADNRQGAFEAVRHLIGLGHRRIGTVNLLTAQANHHNRLQGYRSAMAAARLPVVSADLVLSPVGDTVSYEQRIDAWAAGMTSDPPTALFVADYLMTLATLRVLRRYGLRVPDDVSVACFDDPLSAAYLTPPLTTVRQPVYQIGRRAAERLLQALHVGHDASPPRGPEILGTTLFVRESTCPPKSAHITEREMVTS